MQRSKGFGHQPALDGLRGLALFGVMTYHGGLPIADGAGAFLTVSTFFTLSGFLITMLLLAEWEQTGTVDLRRFYLRRTRRLIPGALVGLSFIVVYAAFAADGGQLSRLRGDVFAAVSYVANWRFMFSGKSYGELFSDPSPVQHYWSLAIEEQFYIVFPLILFGLLVKTGSARVTGGILAAATIILTIVPIVADYGPDRFYYGTDTRAPELLSGAVLAFLLKNRGPIKNWYGRVAVAGLGWAALAATLGAWVLIPENATWLYNGGFAAYSLLTGAILLASIQPTSVVRLFLSVTPLQWMGRVSYGAYVLHWPVFLWMSEDRIPLPSGALFVLRVAVTLVLATASLRLIEQPVRMGLALPSARQFIKAVPIGSAAVVLAAVLVTTSTPSSANDFDTLEEIAAATRQRPDTEVLSETESPVTTAPPAALATLDEPIEVAFVGDSNAMVNGVGVYKWGVETGRIDSIVAAQLGCGVGRGGLRYYKSVEDVPDDCEDWGDSFTTLLSDYDPDIIVLMTGPWDAADRLLPGDETWRAAGDPVYDDYFRSEVQDAVDLLTSTGIPLVLSTSPYITLDGPDAPYPAADPKRMDVINDLLREVAAGDEDTYVLEIADHYDATFPGGQRDTEFRPDGVHLSIDASVGVADWMAEQVLDIWLQHRDR